MIYYFDKQVLKIRSKDFMKIFFYALREYDEQKYVEEFCKKVSV